MLQCHGTWQPCSWYGSQKANHAQATKCRNPNSNCLNEYPPMRNFVCVLRLGVLRYPSSLRYSCKLPAMHWTKYGFFSFQFETFSFPDGGCPKASQSDFCWLYHDGGHIPRCFRGGLLWLCRLKQGVPNH